jgi:exonuclease 3'-5' domain-containing protein 2
MKIVPRTTPMYGNCAVYSKEDILMFYGSERHINYYLRTNLAEKISDNPTSIRLTFEPKGLGNHNDPFSLELKINQCFCCGTFEELSKHHIIPTEYKMHFPKHLRIRDHHDVAPLCVKHHEEYEREALKLKKKLAEQYGAPLNFEVNRAMKRVSSGAYLMTERRASLPQYVQDDFIRLFASYLQKDISEITDELIASLVMRRDMESPYIKFHGKEIMSHVTDVQAFSEMWRQHFLDTLKPQFMPKHWDVKRPLDFRLEHRISFEGKLDRFQE